MTVTFAPSNPNSGHQPSPPPPSPPLPPTNNPGQRPGWFRRPRWKRLTLLQLVVVALASIAPAVIAVVVAAATAGIISEDAMVEVALAAGENPGMITFGAMFLASPVQWLTGRSQVRVRKYLGIVFYLLALSNGAMFVVERSATAMLSEPLLVAGTVALALAAPLFLTSSRLAQRSIGMKNWRILHRLTYVVAAALLAHVILIGDLGPGAALITLGFVARIPGVRRIIEARARTATSSSSPG